MTAKGSVSKAGWYNIWTTYGAICGIIGTILFAAVSDFVGVWVWAIAIWFLIEGVHGYVVSWIGEKPANIFSKLLVAVLILGSGYFTYLKLNSINHPNLQLEFANSQEGFMYRPINTESINAQIPQMNGKHIVIPRNPNDTFDGYDDDMNYFSLPPFISKQPKTHWINTGLIPDQKNRLFTCLYYTVWCDNCQGEKTYWVMLSDSLPWVAPFDAENYNFELFKDNPDIFISEYFPVSIRSPIEIIQ